MGLVWRQGATTNRWVGTDEHGKVVGYVGEGVEAGGTRRWWNGWRNDGSPQGIVAGRFDTVEEAMAAVDELG